MCACKIRVSKRLRTSGDSYAFDFLSLIPMHKIADTERLVIRQLTTGDSSFILELLNTPGWIRYIGDRGVHSLDDATKYIEKGPLASYQSNGFGLWIVTQKESGSPIGMCGLLKRDYLQNPDLGFAFLPEQSDKGYALETVRTVLAIARDTYEISRLDA